MTRMERGKGVSADFEPRVTFAAVDIERPVASRMFDPEPERSYRRQLLDAMFRRIDEQAVEMLGPLADAARNAECELLARVLVPNWDSQWRPRDWRARYREGR